ncbi:ABC transporter substrate-binding protein [Micromonospora zhanjiangensis]|uniref:ABC transporter substrate-binding protein n=1 Tax=Micromonospora zhanjiangensis TaxID=1522057 RepID=A0ABV8KKG7_9ACTN
MSPLDRRQALKLMAALGATGLASACGTAGGTAADVDDATSDYPIKIGMIAPKSGGYKPIGDELIRGFQLFLDLNDKRLGGHPAELVVADEGESAQSGKAAADSLLSQNVHALTGVVSSPVMLGVRDTIEQARVPLIGSNASPTNLQSVVYIWRTSFVNDEPGKALGPYVAEYLSKLPPSQRRGAGGRVSIISPQYTGGTDAVRGFQQSFGDGATDPRLAEPVWTEYITNPGKNTFKADISRLLQQDPDAVYCFFAGTAAVEFLRQLHAAGYRKQIFGSGFLTEGNVLTELRPAEAEGIITALNYSADINNAANRVFASAFRKAHSAEPTTYAMASYDAAQVLNKAIRIAGDRPTPQDINLAIGQIGQIDSPRGSWQFNQPRTPQQKWYLRRVQRDGETLSNVLINELTALG